MRIRGNRWVRSAAAVVLCVCASPASIHAQPAPGPMAEASDLWSGYIAEASRRFGVPESWIRAVMQIESGGDVRAVSPKGAMGLMQIMPETWAELRNRYGLGADPYDPRDNILAGAAYLREMHDRYGYPALFAAYNAGPRRVDEHLSDGRGLPAETQAYLAALGHADVRGPRSPIIGPAVSLFVDLHGAGQKAAFRPSSAGGLFVPVSTARKPTP
ncbi:lytic transglycosylase domain-containing protein [Inquilinus sp. NPDC058860]|uniref:lytic transglycosylase domain-containing protein n=1 Tax=Inquilinus sp. NPDC058860 TaxID=3346652 RepID=UPI00369A478D